MLKLIRKTADAALGLVYPQGVSCALCGADLETQGRTLCAACEAKMPFALEPLCPGCGRALSSLAAKPHAISHGSRMGGGLGGGTPPPIGFCRMCREFGPACDGGGFASFCYEGIARDLLIDFKFEDKTGYADLFAYYMAETLKASGIIGEIGCIVPVPMNRRRKFARGFNQSELLASRVARAFGVPLIKNALARPVYTREASRTGGGPKERMESALKSYRPGKGKLEGFAVLLVDDILTSGATVRACAAILKRMGAERVYSLVAAAVPE